MQGSSVFESRDGRGRVKAGRRHIVRAAVLLAAILVVLSVIFVGTAAASPGDYLQSHDGTAGDYRGMGPVAKALLEPAGLTAAGFSASTIPNAPAPAGTGSISGRVTNSATGTGIAYLIVAVMDSDFNVITGLTTNGSGYYSLTGLPNEPVLVFTDSLASDLNYVDEYYNDVQVAGNFEAAGATWLNLAATPTRSNINFSLVAGKSISGDVRNGSSVGLEGAEVDVYDLSGNFMLYGLVESWGAYSVTGLPAGQYLVCTYNDLGYVDEWYDNVPVLTDWDGASATIVNVTSSNATSRNFTLELGRDIGGTVTASAGGAALADVTIRVQPLDRAWEIYTSTDGAGNYTMQGLPSGQYYVSTENYDGYVDEWYNDHKVPGDVLGEEATPVNVTSASNYEVDFALDTGYTISGVVTDSSTGNALLDPGTVLEVYNAEGTVFGGAWVGGDGETAYSTWAMPAGTYYVRTLAELTGAPYVDEWYNNKRVGQYELGDAVILAEHDATGINFGLDRLTRYEQTDTHIYYAPTWTLSPSPSSSGGSYFHSTTAGASATIWFAGTRLDWITVTNTSTGLADVYVDDELVEEDLDLGAAVAEYQVRIWSTGTLSDGLHKVVLALAPGNIAGKRITLDAVEVAGALAFAPPVVTALSPASGTAAGGTTVTITGTSLTGATAVRFGEIAATNVAPNGAGTQVTCTSPAHETGLVNVTVTTPSGTSSISGTGNDYTYTVPAPTVTVLSPVSGTTVGGTTVTITGTYLTGATAVSFGGTAATEVIVNSPTQITASSPVHAAGLAEVTVTTPGGTSATAGTGNDYTYVPPVPTFAEMGPTSGTTSGGTSVTIIGTGLVGATAVSFGGTAATSITVNSATQITATSPAHVAGTVEVTVTTAGGTTPTEGTGNDYTYVAPEPTVTAVSPPSGNIGGGTTVIITGTGLMGVTAVSFGSNAATGLAANSPTQVTCVSPAHAEGAVDVTVTTAGGTSATSAADQFTYVAAPTRYEQTDGHIVKSGTWVDWANNVASGQSYGRSATVGASATIYFTGTQIAWIAFKGTTTGKADVYVDGTKVTPTPIDLAGTGTQSTVWTSNALSNTHHTVEIRRSDLSGTKYLTVDAIEVIGSLEYAPPVVTGISPATGSIEGGTPVTLSGTGFLGTSSVTIDSLPAIGWTVNPAGTQISFTTPPHAAGAVTVEVTTPNGTDTASYTYAEMPDVNRYESADLNIVRTGVWVEYPSLGSSAASYSRSSTSLASATIWFNGTQLDYIAMKGGTTGYAEIWVDGVKVTGTSPINLAASPAVYQQKVWSTDALSDGLHSVKIVRSPTSAIGKYLTLDAVDIYGTIAAPPTRYQQGDSRIVKTGVWANFSSAGASGGTYGRTNTADATATIAFNGTRLDWIGMKGTTAGTVEVYLDGSPIPTATINLNAPTAIYQQVLWSTGALLEGPHTVLLKRIGTGTLYMNIDAIDIWETP